MKTLAAIFLALFIFSGTASAMDFAELENLYNQTTFMLWTDTEGSEGRPACYGFYWKPQTRTPYGLVIRSLYLSAGHCVVAPTIRHGQWDYQDPFIKFVIFKKNELPDMLFGEMTDMRYNAAYFGEFSGEPSPDGVFYTNRHAPEWGKKLELQKLKFLEQDKDGFWIFESENPLAPGMSGSPVISQNGELAGILTAVGANNNRLAYVMPIRDVVKILKDNNLPSP